MKKIPNIKFDALQEAVSIAGSQGKLGAIVGKTQAQVSVWVNRDKKLPPDLVLIVERATGVSRHRLRPDVFGDVDDRE
jgi:DNA-binding transcriptional regulator YdaS (Cro superfamily)